MLRIWTVYNFVSYDLQINLAHELLVYHVCGKLDSSYKFSIDICRSAVLNINCLVCGLKLDALTPL